jgi:hypothetical protein
MLLKLFIFKKEETFQQSPLKENKTFFVKKNCGFGIRENMSQGSYLK